MFRNSASSTTTGQIHRVELLDDVAEERLSALKRDNVIPDHELKLPFDFAKRAALESGDGAQSLMVNDQGIGRMAATRTV